MRQEIKDILLNTVDLKVLHPDGCEKSFENFLNDNMIGYDAADKLIVGEMLHFYNRYYHLCVEGEEKSPCFGDSGGPLICEGNIIYAAYSFNFASYIFVLVFCKVEIILEEREVAFLSPSNMPSTFEFFGCAVEKFKC